MNTSTPTLNRAPAVNPLSFIDRLIAEVELTPTQYERAKTSYEAVADVLNKPGSPILVHTPAIYPQGSIRIGTTIRPWAKDEFDLDLLCWIALSGKTYTPGQVYQLVWDTLSADGTYRSMLEKGCRCIRIRVKRQLSFSFRRYSSDPRLEPPKQYSLHSGPGTEGLVLNPPAGICR